MAIHSERLVILLSKAEKARLAKLAARERVSMGELVRSALIKLDDFRPETKAQGQGGAARSGNKAGTAAGAVLHDVQISPEQAATLDRLAEVTLQSMARANQALDKAFSEVEATKAYLTQKRADAKVAAKSEADP